LTPISFAMFSHLRPFCGAAARLAASFISSPAACAVRASNGSPVSAQFGKLIAEETGKWAKMVRAAGIKPEEAQRTVVASSDLD
jgi:hypothetical protein